MHLNSARAEGRIALDNISKYYNPRVIPSSKDIYVVISKDNWPILSTFCTLDNLEFLFLNFLGVFGHSFSSFTDCMFGQLTRNDQTNAGLYVP